MARIEKQMDRIRARRTGLESRMAELGQAQRFDELSAVSAEAGELAEELDSLELEWLEAAELAG